MAFVRLQTFIKKRGLSIVFYGLILLILISPAAKSWVLQQVIKSGILNASMDKSRSTGSNLENLSFDYTDNHGRIKNTLSLKGKVVLINFWASWCAPCRAEMPSLNSLYETMRNDRRFVFLFINEDTDSAKAVTFLRRQAFAAPFQMSRGPLPQAIFKGALPTTVVLDRTGKVAFHHEGMSNYNTDVFIGQMKALL